MKCFACNELHSSRENNYVNCFIRCDLMYMLNLRWSLTDDEFYWECGNCQILEISLLINVHGAWALFLNNAHILFIGDDLCGNMIFNWLSQRKKTEPHEMHCYATNYTLL